MYQGFTTNSKGKILSDYFTMSFDYNVEYNGITTKLTSTCEKCCHLIVSVPKSIAKEFHSFSLKSADV